MQRFPIRYSSPMPGLSALALTIAALVAQLSSAPVVFRWEGEDAVIEAVSVGPDGRAAGFWCEGVHGSEGRCFAQVGRDAPQPIFRGGAIDAADAGLQRPFAGVRHFSLDRGAIAWQNGVPRFLVACHTGAISGVCEQLLGGEPRIAGTTTVPLDGRPTVVGELTIWNDRDVAHTTFQAGERMLDVCCAGDVAAYAAVPATASGDVLLVYATGGRAAELRAARFGPDLRLQHETVLARGIAPPSSIDAVATANGAVAVWAGGGVFAAIGGKVVKLSDAGAKPALTTDGNRIIAAWLERGAVMTAELSRRDLPRSLLALHASMDDPFLALQGVVAHWRDGGTIRQRPLTADR